MHIINSLFLNANTTTGQRRVQIHNNCRNGMEWGPRQFIKSAYNNDVRIHTHECIHSQICHSATPVETHTTCSRLSWDCQFVAKYCVRWKIGTNVASIRVRSLRWNNIADASGTPKPHRGYTNCDLMYTRFGRMHTILYQVNNLTSHGRSR